MKVAITGKGGVGKTTSLQLSRECMPTKEGPFSPLMWIRMQTWDFALGFSEEEVNSITPISKMRKLVEERTGANAANKFFKLNPQVAISQTLMQRRLTA
jgi:CO dehydrogenase maturation factor